MQNKKHKKIPSLFYPKLLQFIFRIFCICVLFVPPTIHAQLNFDSLIVVWNDPVNEDTIRLNAVNLAIEQIIRNEHDRAFNLAQDMLNKATERGLEKHQATALLHQGRALAFENIKMDTKLELFQKSFVLFEKIGDFDGASHALANIGSTYADQGEFGLAIAQLEQSFPLAKKYHSYYLISNILHILGGTYSQIDAEAKALNYFEEGLASAEKGGLIREMSQSLSAIGNLYHRSQDYNAALGYDKRALELAKQTGIKR